MPKDQIPSQAETLKRAEQKAMFALTSYRNNATEEQLAIVVERKIPNARTLVQKVREAEFKLKDVLGKKEYTASQLEDFTDDLKMAMGSFRTQIESLEIDEWEIMQRASLQLLQYKLLAYSEQFRIVMKEKIPVSDELYSDLRNTHYLLELKSKKEDRIPIEIEALTNKMVSLMKRFYAVLEAHDKDDKESKTKKRDTIGRAKIMLRAYENLNKQDKLSLTAQDRNGLPEPEAKRMNELFLETASAALHLNNRISDDNPVVVIKAMSNRLEGLIQKTSQRVKAIREKKDDQASLDKMDEYFSA
jgi:hypothetical protein